MEKSSKNCSILGSKLCFKCHSFSANSKLGSYCYRCYIDKRQSLAKLVADRQIAQNKKKTETDLRTVTNEKGCQVNHGVCWYCDRSTGLNSFKCKCRFSFCKRHRLPESHSCDFDFISHGRKRIAKENPLLRRSKINRI